MILITRAMLRSQSKSTLRTFKKIHQQNLGTHLFLKKLQNQIRNGANTLQLFCEIEDKLRTFENFEIEWPPQNSD